MLSIEFSMLSNELEIQLLLSLDSFILPFISWISLNILLASSSNFSSVVPPLKNIHFTDFVLK